MSDQPEITVGAASEHPAEEPELETVMHLMWDRIEALESARRGMQRALVFAATAGVLALVVLSARSVGDRSEGEPLVLRDLAGRVRARLEVDPQGDLAMLRLFATDGSEQIALKSSSAGPTLTFASGQGDPRLRLGMDTNAPLLEVVRRDGVTERQLLPVSAAGPAVANPAPVASSVRAPAAPPAQAQPARRVREASTRGSMLWFPPDSKSGRRSSSAACRPGTLGCERVSRIEARSPEG